MNPLAGVLIDARRLYRAHALPLISVASVFFLFARGMSAVIYGSGGFYGISGGRWSDLVGLFAALLTLSAVARMITPDEAGVSCRQLSSRDEPSSVASFLRPVAVAAILASVLAGAWGLLPLAGHFAVLISLPALYLAFMGLATIPAAVIERSGPLISWRRSWQLIRRNEWRLIGTLTQVGLVNILVMLVPILIASYPGRPYLHITLWVVEDIFFGPFLALVVILIYHRLSEARVAASLDEAVSGQVAGYAA